jgi:hypothetical protein
MEEGKYKPRPKKTQKFEPEWQPKPTPEGEDMSIWDEKPSDIKTGKVEIRPRKRQG